MDIERRIYILTMVDQQTCPCGKPFTRGIAEDEGWFIDVEAAEDGTELAVIRCPECW